MILFPSLVIAELSKEYLRKSTLEFKRRITPDRHCKLLLLTAQQEHLRQYGLRQQS